jgi:hypothetical protein
LVIIFTLLKAFANGGASLTGIEAVSNAVSAFKPPEGINARRVLVTEGLILGTLVAGISWLAHLTHAAPYKLGFPTVISQEADIVFGSAGHFMFYVVPAATALILYTGGNTSFNGFPFLTSFVAEDSFLPRWMMKRGQRLVFSNGIIVLTVLSVTLIGVVGANVNALVPFYAIGVFTAFTMAGFGMAKYYSTHKGPGWRRKLVICFSSGVLTSIVVVIFAVVKFTAGAWLILIIFPVGVFALIRLNREYRTEARVLENLGERRASGVDRASRTTRAGWSSSSWTTSTWPPWPRCGTRRACGRPASARCISSSTPSKRSGCAPPGCPTAASRSSSSTAPTGGWPGPRPNWSGTRRKHQARK